MRGMLAVAVLLTSMLTLAAPAMATDTQTHPNLDAATIRAQQAQIQQEARARKGRYKDMSEEQRSELFAYQAKVEQLTNGLTRTTELPEVDQIALFNALESIEALLNKAEDERLVCERHKPVGSNRPQTICKTVAERRAEREAAQRDIGKRNQTCFKDPQGQCI